MASRKWFEGRCGSRPLAGRQLHGNGIDRIELKSHAVAGLHGQRRNDRTGNNHVSAANFSPEAASVLATWRTISTKSSEVAAGWARGATSTSFFQMCPISPSKLQPAREASL